MNQKHMDSILPNYLYSLKKKTNKQELSICVSLDMKGLKQNKLWQVRVREAFPFLIAILSLTYHPSP